jgi:hypothetical protein
LHLYRVTYLPAVAYSDESPNQYTITVDQWLAGLADLLAGSKDRYRGRGIEQYEETGFIT